MKDYTGKQGKTKDLDYYMTLGRKMLTNTCGVCPIYDKPSDAYFRGNFGASIGFGSIGQGQTFEANYNSLRQYRLKMNVIKAHHEPEMSISILGKEITAPVMGASLSGVKASLNDIIPEEIFYQGLLRGAQAFGSIGMVGNTSSIPDDMGINIVGENNGFGIPIFKPQSQERLIKLFRLAEELNVIAVGVDLDGVGSTFWTAPEKRVYRKSEKDLQELVDCTEKPVIFKGIMNPEDAVKVVDSGAGACYVSNHGGRVMDCGQGVAEVLPDIAQEISGKIAILADGAVRTGFDVLKVIALGADVALIGRPIAQAVLGGGEVAVKMYLEYVKDDLRRVMILTGCDTLKDVTMNILARTE
jgi:4-hydroxymandelate oxidase